MMGRTKIKIRVGGYSRIAGETRVVASRLSVTDSTSPSSTQSSAVLITPDTEIIVAPRTRGAPPSVINDTMTAVISGGTEGNSSGLGSYHGARLRSIPQRIALQWKPPDSTMEGRVGAFVSGATMDTLKGRLGTTLKSGFMRVNLKPIISSNTQGTPQPPPETEAKPHRDEENGVDVDLIEWNDVPEGHVVLPDYNTLAPWSMVKYVTPAFV